MYENKTALYRDKKPEKSSSDVLRRKTYAKKEMNLAR